MIAVLLLLAEAWWIPCPAAVAGVLFTACLRIGAAVTRRTESREAARQWGELGRAHPSPHPTVPGTSWPSASAPGRWPSP
ncbi:hypothetical protein [Streptomyces monashensis]|uniref:Uncharacterized protein n=1 Tax=Streptomyces monashensis TaxID=1678012 RepID=A0A1S2QC33_9ACTN|nr:hypothetical protein [Streptomyces monashensis]OIK03709.1 hypothetical protein BIV23_20885 [Streptomyces monashensis]